MLMSKKIMTTQRPEFVPSAQITIKSHEIFWGAT